MHAKTLLQLLLLILIQLWCTRTLTEETKKVFEMFIKPIRRLAEQKGFQNLTEPQEKAIPKILEKKNILLISPTATGKTEAAVLPVLNMLLCTPEKSHGIKILYLTPLRALNLLMASFAGCLQSLRGVPKVRSNSTIS